MLQTIIGALLPVVVTLLLGILAGWRGDQDARAAEAFNRMVLVYALPLLLFAGTATTSRQALAGELPLAGALLIGLLVPFAAAYGAARYAFHRDASASALQALSFGFPAIAFTGIPILTPLIDGRATAVVAWAGIINNIVVLPIVLVMLSMAKDASRDTGTMAIVGSAARHALTQPVVIAPVVAIILVLFGVSIPTDAISALKLLGGTVGGVSLFASGVILQAQKISFSLPALVSAFGRVLVVPGLAYLLLTSLGADPELRRMVVLGLGLASAPMQVILAVRYDVYQRENASLLLLSNILCIPSLAFFIWLTS